MGIDLIDLSFRIKNGLGVDLSLADWNALAQDQDISVKDLYALILFRRNLKPTGTPVDSTVSESVWQRVHSNILAKTAKPTETITPQSHIMELFPDIACEEAWRKVQEGLEWQLPPLQLAEHNQRLIQRWHSIRNILAATSYTVVILVAFTGQIAVAVGAALSSLVLLVLGAILLDQCQQRMPKELPDDVVTLKDLCSRIEQSYGWTIPVRPNLHEEARRQREWEQLKLILVNGLGVDPEEVTYEAKLIRDLGAA